jgi:soluble lytic murein transglycosylase
MIHTPSNFRRDINRLDRGFAPRLSSMSRQFTATSILIGVAIAAYPAEAQNLQEAPLTTIQSVTPAPPLIQPLTVQPVRTTDPLSNAINVWRSLQQSDNFSFGSYANFLVAHPGWPSEVVFRKNAERMIRADGEPFSTVVAFFRKFPPLSATAHLRFAEALDASGSRSDALASARQSWISGVLTPEDEARFASRFSSALQPGDQDLRMDRLLWSRSTSNAARQIALVSPAKRALFNARLGFLVKAPDIAARDAAVDANQRNDAGYVADRVYWLRISGQAQDARAYLAKPPALNAPPLDPAKWLETLEGTIRSAVGDQQYSYAASIARQLEVTYPAGTLVRDRPFAERDNYTDIAWLGGKAALEKIGRPADAIRLFELYAQAARSAQTRAKGFYWAGRAAEAAGRRDVSNLHYAAAAEYFDQFHGQLATEKLGRTLMLPLEPATIEISGSERSAFDRNEVVRAMILLGQQGHWQDQTKFVRTIANSVEGAANHALAGDLANRINRPDLGLLVGKSAREDGYPGYFKPSFPIVQVPSEHASSWTMIHAITRQESQFDREALSRVGARGYMQLMPGTARETAPSAGVSYDLGSLTKDPQYNIRLGSTYFGQLMTRFGGSYVLSVAAYNAGPGNVNKWLRANGDPRVPGTDVMAWIEAIPLTETRGYVQHVLENAVVYDMLNPRRGNRAPTMISSYLGRAQAVYGSR